MGKGRRFDDEGGAGRELVRRATGQAGDGAGDDDENPGNGPTREEMLAELGRRGFDTTPFEDPAECSDAALAEILRGSEDLGPGADDYDADEQYDDVVNNPLYQGGGSEYDEPRLKKSPGGSRVFAEALADSGTHYLGGGDVPVVHEIKNYSGFYNCFAEEYRAAGIDKAAFLRDAMRYGKQLGIGRGVRRPAAADPAPPRPHKYSEDSETRRVEMFFDAHPREFGMVGVSRADYLQTFARSGLTATEFLRGA